MDDFDQRLQELKRKFADAVYKESCIRDASFLPITLHICGLPVKQFTPYHYILLDFANSPFVYGDKEPNEGHIAEFLWVVSTEYKDNDPVGKEKYIKEKLANLDYVTCVTEILEYLNHAFLDVPPKGNQEGKVQQISDTSWVTGYIDAIASEYHWTDEYIVHLPFPRILQYMKSIESRHLTKAGQTQRPINKWSDAVKGEITKLNLQRLKEENDKKGVTCDA